MQKNYVKESVILGSLLLLGLIGLGFFLSSSLLSIKSLERTVEVKGLSEREVTADIAIWPITFNVADNDLIKLSSAINDKNAAVENFLKSKGFKAEEISVNAPSIVDKLAREYDNGIGNRFRYMSCHIL